MKKWGALITLSLWLPKRKLVEAEPAVEAAGGWRGNRTPAERRQPLRFITLCLGLRKNNLLGITGTCYGR